MNTRALPLAVYGVLAAAAASCFVPGFEVVDPAPLGSSGKGGGTSGGGGASGSGGMACQHAVWPEPPKADDPGGSDGEFIAAMRTIDMGDGAADLDSVGPKIGYDLDQRCTGYGDGVSCVEPKGSMDSDFKDGPGGIDNAGAKLFNTAQKLAPKISSKQFSAGSESGAWSLLIRVREYNGLKNDTQVNVAVFTSPGIHEEACVPADAMPKWDGSDVWPIDVLSLQKGAGPGSDGNQGQCSKGKVTGYTFDKPAYVDAKAYVAGGVLVANLPESTIVISSNGVATNIKLTAGFITGEIVKVAAGFKLAKGVFTGRWKTTDMFGTVSHLASNGQNLCTDHPVYAAVKNLICGARDITSALAGPTTACDSISLAIAFETEPAKLGIVWQGTPVQSPCTPDKDPALDSCDKK